MDKNHKLLFHGAKSRIEGKLDIHKSRTNNDLGQGFYTGERYEQAISFISGFEKSSVYIFDFKEEGLKGKKYNVNQEWMMTIAYYRGALEEYENHPVVLHLHIHIHKFCNAILSYRPPFFQRSLAQYYSGNNHM